MSDTNTGGMFSKLINPETAKPKKSEAAGKPVENIRKEEEAKPTEHSPTLIKEAVKKSVQIRPKVIKRRQISAYLTPDQLSLLKQLYFKLNSGDVEIEKSEIIGLGVEIISKLLSIQVPRYSNTQKLREYLNTQISEYLNTKVLKHSST